MRFCRRLAAALFLLTTPAIGAAPGGRAPARDLTFHERLDCQRAIERVYYGHQVGTARNFDEAVPEPVIERKVRDSLRQSMALESRWRSPITAEALRREMERIARDTRYPDRLNEIYEALGHDPLLIQECLARPILTDRIARARFEADEGIHGDNSARGGGPHRVTWDAWWAVARGSFDESRARTIADPSAPVPGAASSAPACVPDDTWDNGALAETTVSTESATAVWTGTEMIVWGGIAIGTTVSTGRRYDPLIDAWRILPAAGAPEARYLHTAVWTGTEMIVWGGSNGAANLGTGARYDPAADAWAPVSSMQSPQSRSRHTAVWTGTRMVIWGGEGSQSFDTGGVYDPATDSWDAISRTKVPAARHSHTAVWSGDRMIVWGGQDGATFFGDGAEYDPQHNHWTAIAASGAPAARAGHTAVWTGALMVVWGGEGISGLLGSGGRYEPSSNTWSAVSSITAPQPRENHTALWSGSRMIIWGGRDASVVFASGGRYDPAADAWDQVAGTGNPPGRYAHTAVWTGDRMIVWGGAPVSVTGGKYDPLTDVWTSIASGAPPSPRAGHVAVWTGNVMIVWNGGTGGRYDPLTDAWTPISTVNDPNGATVAVWTGQVMLVWGNQPAGGSRYDPIADAWRANSTQSGPPPDGRATAVWTGTEMIVWGGRLEFGSNSGGVYDPAADTWRFTTINGAPARRWGHSALWTGSRMVVWGGITDPPLSPDVKYNDGALYDPAANTWTPISTAGAPSPRYSHAAVWTGSRMIVWGGYGTPTVVGGGGIYDPGTNTWAPMTTTGEPLPRGMIDSRLPAVWTGREMVVWSGQVSGPQSGWNTGGRYDPSADTWTLTSTLSAPIGREEFTSIWTGSFMIVWGGRLFLPGFPATDTGGRYAMGHAEDGDGDGLAECAGDCNDGSAAAHPGAPETCDGLDNDCDGLADEGFDGDADGVTVCGGDCDDADPQRGPYVTEICDGQDNNCNGAADEGPDPDFDGFAICDCAPADPGVHSISPEVANVSIVPPTDPNVTMTWNSPKPAAGSSTVSDVLRGSIANLPVRGHFTEICAAPGLSGSSHVDSSTPPLGTGWYYLVRGRNICGGGTYGVTSGGSPRNSAGCP